MAPLPKTANHILLDTVHAAAIKRATSESIEEVRKYVATLTDADVDGIHTLIKHGLGGETLGRRTEHPINVKGKGSSDFRTLTSQECHWQLTPVLFAALFGHVCYAQHFLRPLALIAKKNYPFPSVWKHLFEQYQTLDQPAFFTREIALTATKKCEEEQGSPAQQGTSSQNQDGRASEEGEPGIDGHDPEEEDQTIALGQTDTPPSPKTHDSPGPENHFDDSQPGITGPDDRQNDGTMANTNQNEYSTATLFGRPPKRRKVIDGVSWDRSGHMPVKDIRSTLTIFSHYVPHVVLLDSKASAPSQSQTIPAKVLFLPEDDIGPLGPAKYAYCDVKAQHITIFVSNLHTAAQKSTGESFLQALDARYPSLRASRAWIQESPLRAAISDDHEDKTIYLLAFAIERMHDRRFRNLSAKFLRRWLSALFPQSTQASIIELIISGRIEDEHVDTTHTQEEAKSTLRRIKDGAAAVKQTIEDIANLRRIVCAAMPSRLTARAGISAYAQSPSFSDAQSQAVINKDESVSMALFALINLLLVDEDECKKWLLKASAQRRKCLAKVDLTSYEDVKRDSAFKIASEDQLSESDTDDEEES